MKSNQSRVLKLPINNFIHFQFFLVFLALLLALDERQTRNNPGIPIKKKLTGDEHSSKTNKLPLRGKKSYVWRGEGLSSGVVSGLVTAGYVVPSSGLGWC